MQTFQDILKDFSHQTALVRVDFNVLTQAGKISDATRVCAVKPTIDALQSANIRTVLVSHFKNPKPEDAEDSAVRASFSFAPMIPELSQILGHTVELHSLDEADLKDKIKNMPANTIFLLENSRFWPGEKKCDMALAKRLADLADVFINDAFSCAHRDHASVTGVAKLLPTFAGLHFQKELAALHKAFEHPQHPVVGVIGGSKVSSKFPILESLLPKVDFLAIGGAMVHTFLEYQGLSVGKSLYEPEYVEKAGELLDKYRVKILFPCDVWAATDLEASPEVIEVSNGVSGIPADMAAFDIGPDTVRAWSPVLQQARTVIWNGTLGVAEHPPFDEGSRKIAQLITENKDAFSLAGGGHTLTALKELGVANQFSHVCTGGGAFLEWLANGHLLAEATFHSEETPPLPKQRMG